MLNLMSTSASIFSLFFSLVNCTVAFGMSHPSTDLIIRAYLNRKQIISFCRRQAELSLCFCVLWAIPDSSQGLSLFNLQEDAYWGRKPKQSAGPEALPVALEYFSMAAWFSLYFNFWCCHALYLSKLQYTLALKWYIEFNFKSCLRNHLPFVTTMHRPTHFSAVQSAVKRVQLSSTNCSKTVHLSKAADLKLFINTTGRHLVLPPARKMSNTPLVIHREAEVKWGNSICLLSVGSTKIQPF